MTDCIEDEEACSLAAELVELTGEACGWRS